MGSVCLLSLLVQTFRFALQALLPLHRWLFWRSDFFGSRAPRVFPSLSPFLQKVGMEVGGLGMPLCCFLRVFLSSRSTWSSGRGGGASGRTFGARGLASVSSVHSWTGDPEVALLRRTPATFPVGSPSSSLHARRDDGAGESSGGFLCSRLPLPPYLCTLGEVVSRVRLPSAAPVRVLPGLPIFGLGDGRVLEPALG